MKTSKILVLGGSGMLGSMVCDYFVNHTPHTVAFTYNKNFPEKLKRLKQSVSFYKLDVTADQGLRPDLKAIFLDFCPDYVINCIGLIKYYCNNISDKNETLKAIKINALFPFTLSEINNEFAPQSKIIQIATDCVYSGKEGKYDENAPHDPIDVYGKTKSLGEVYDQNLLNIRCSIIGPELSGKSSLLEWFLKNRDGDKIMGFEHHLWNGVTTLQFAELCHKIIDDDLFSALRDKNYCLHYIVNESVSKYVLLNIFNEAFNRNIGITSENKLGGAVDRTISSVYLENDMTPMKDSINRLSSYMITSSVFKEG